VRTFSVVAKSLSGNPLTLPLTPAARGERELKEPLRGQLPGFRTGSKPGTDDKKGGESRLAPESQGMPLSSIDR